MLKTLFLFVAFTFVLPITENANADTTKKMLVQCKDNGGTLDVELDLTTMLFKAFERCSSFGESSTDEWIGLASYKRTTYVSTAASQDYSREDYTFPNTKFSIFRRVQESNSRPWTFSGFSGCHTDAKTCTVVLH